MIQYNIKWNNKKLKSLYNKMNKIGTEIEGKVKEGLENATKSIQELALEYKRGKKEGIMVEITDNKGILKGRVYTDKEIMPYALFLEFGTGIYAELPHIGVTKTFIESGYKYWYLPVTKAKREFGKKITIYGTDYYVMYAQKPRPFMRTAGFEGRDEATRLIEDSIYKFLKEVAK